MINLLCEHAMINAYVDSVRPVPAHLVEEVAREFQLDEIAPVAGNGAAHHSAATTNTEELLEDLHELLGRLRQANVVASRERKS